jgi:hypothetical protein
MNGKPRVATEFDSRSMCRRFLLEPSRVLVPTLGDRGYTLARLYDWAMHRASSASLGGGANEMKGPPYALATETPIGPQWELPAQPIDIRQPRRQPTTCSREFRTLLHVCSI